MSQAKAKKDVETTAKDRTVLWIGVSAGLALLMAIAVFVMSSKSATMRINAEREITQYDEMKGMRKQINAFKQKGTGSKKVDERGDLSGFLSRTANSAGLPSASISFKTGTRTKDSKGWEETPVTADLSGGKDAPIPHQTLVAFLAAVEKDSTLKAKNLTLTYAGSDFSHVTILFSSYRRD